MSDDSLTEILIDQKKYLISKAKKKALMSLIKEIVDESIESLNQDVFLDRKKELPQSAIALRGARAKEGISQLKLAKKLKVNSSNVSNMENGKRPIGEKMAKRLGKALNISYKVFLED